MKEKKIKWSNGYQKICNQSGSYTLCFNPEYYSNFISENEYYFFSIKKFLRFRSQIILSEAIQNIISVRDVEKGIFQKKSTILQYFICAQFILFYILPQFSLNQFLTRLMFSLTKFYFPRIILFETFLKFSTRLFVNIFSACNHFFLHKKILHTVGGYK